MCKLLPRYDIFGQITAPTHPAPRPPLIERVRHWLGPRVSKLDFLLDCALKYGDVVDLTLGPRTFLLSNPDDIRHILETNPQNFAKTRHLVGQTGQRLFGRGLLTSSGTEAMNQRRTLNPLFGRQAVSHFDAVIVDFTTEMLGHWEAGTNVEVAAEMLGLTQRILVKSLLSMDLRKEGAELRQALYTRRYHTEHYFRWPLPFSDRLPLPANLKRRRATEYVDQLLSDMIRERRKAASLPDDWLAVLMQVHEGMLTDDQVRDQCWTLLETGYETLGLVLGWLWYLLAKNTDAQAKVAVEVESVLDGQPPTAANVTKLKFLNMALSETMRLYPPTWIFVRVPLQNDVLPSGAQMRAGAKLYLSPYVSHRLPRYFPDPEQFDPQRFAEPTQSARPRLAYYPFSAGQRVCLGQGMALMEAPLIAATIV